MNQKSPIGYYSFDKFKHKSILYSTVIFEKQQLKLNKQENDKHKILSLYIWPYD